MMYINGLFLLLFWCLGWAEVGFLNSLYVVVILSVALLVGYKRYQAALGLLVFLLASIGQYSLVNSQFPTPFAGKDLRIRACVSELNANLSGLSLLLSDANIHVPIVTHIRRAKPVYKGLPHALPGTVKVNIYPHTDEAQPQLNGLDERLGLAALIGQKVELIVRLKAAKNYHNPQSYDYIRWTQLNGQIASGYVKEWLVTGSACGGMSRPKLVLEQLRQRLWQGLQDYSETGSMSSQTVGVWGALVLGKTSALTAEHWRVLAATGTTHLMVISGLHVGLVAVLVMLLVRLLLSPFAIRGTWGVQLGAWSGLLAALAFALLSGFGLPAQRAIIMLVGLLWGLMWGFQVNFTQRLFFAFFVTLMLQPISAVSLGFWLSYTAVFALGLVWYRSTSKGWWHQVIQLLAAQAALSLLLLPVIAMATDYVSLVGPLVNIVLVPLFSLVVIPILLLISMVAIFTTLPPFVCTVIDFTLSLLWQGLETLSGLTWSQVFVGWLPIEGFVSALMAGYLCLVIRRWHWPVLILLIPLVLFMVFTATKRHAGKNQGNSQLPVVVTLLDVGQGLSVWIHQGDRNMLYDVGNHYPSGFNLVDSVIMPEMLALDVEQLDVLVISHWDMDHSGGLPTLLKQKTVRRLILPSEKKLTREQDLDTTSVNVSRCASTPWQNLWQDFASKLMWRQIALADDHLKGNNASCVVQLNIYGRKVLITGDIEAKAETRLIKIASKSAINAPNALNTLNTLNTLNSDILIAPHHGSKTSSTESFLSYVRPAYVLISAGKNNPYGHPHQTITDAYWRHGSHWYNTGRHGQIQVVFEANGEYKVTPFLP